MSFRQMVKHIIIGNLRRIFCNKNNIEQNRLNICLKCEDKGYIKGFGDYCTHCGCPIKSKIMVKNELCFKNKW